MNDEANAPGIARQAGVAYVVAEIFMVACAYLWLFVFATFIESGGDNAFL